MPTIGERIRASRQRLGLSVDEVAARLGKNRSTVYRYKNNAIDGLSVASIELLAKVLEVSPVFLMGWEFPKRD